MSSLSALLSMYEVFNLKINQLLTQQREIHRQHI